MSTPSNTRDFQSCIQRRTYLRTYVILCLVSSPVVYVGMLVSGLHLTTQQTKATLTSLPSSLRLMHLWRPRTNPPWVLLWALGIMPECNGPLTAHTTPPVNLYHTIYSTIPHHTTPHHAIPHHTTPHHATPCHPTPHHPTPHHSTPHHTTPHHSLPRATHTLTLLHAYSGCALPYSEPFYKGHCRDPAGCPV